MRGMTTLNSELVSELAPLLERAVGVALDEGQSLVVFSLIAPSRAVFTYTTVIGAG